METNRVSEFEGFDIVEIKKLVDIIRRRLWLLIAGLALGVVGAALFSYFQQPVYEAATKVLVTRSTQNQSADITGGVTLQQTADTYVQFLQMEPVLNMVSERLGYEIDPNKDVIRVALVPNTQIINIAVEDTDGERAARIADTLVQVLIEQNEVLQAGRYANSEADLDVQIAEMEKQIDDLQSELDIANRAALQVQIDNLQERIDDTQKAINDLEAQPEDTADRSARLDQLRSLMASYQKTYTDLVVTGEIQGSDDEVARLEKNYDLYQQLYLNLLSSRESVRMARLQNTPNVVQVSPALIADKPIRPRTALNMMLGGLAGILLAGVAVFLLEYLDDTIKTPEEVERMFGLTVLGYVTEVSNSERSQGLLSVAKQPRSPVAEAFRSLRTNLEFSGIDQPLRTILVTSAGPGEGKSTVAVNLASIISQNGKRVTLLDADMRRPTIHRFFDFSNRIGLTDVFRSRLEVKDVLQPVEQDSNINVITTGSLPPNPTELLASEKMNTVLAGLKKSSDIIIIDSAPAIVSDAQVLSAKVDGVLVVVRPGKTQEEEIRATLEQLKRAGANVVGVVFNRIPQDRTRYYGGYKHYSPYHYRSYEYTSPAPDVEETQPEEK